MFDTHVHLNDAKLYGDLDLHIREAKENGVNRMMVIGYDVESSKLAVEIASKYAFVYAAIGVHPSEFKEENRDYVKEIEALINDRVVCIGEIGLDYYWNDNKEVQKRYFKEFIDLAYKYNLPICIHCREAISDTLEIIKEKQDSIIKGIMHCYAGSKEMVKDFVDNKMYLSFGGVLTFKNGRKMVESFLSTPKDRILVETDCPYLTPEPYRGKLNSPKYVTLVVDKMAELLNISREEVINITTDNAKRVLNINE